MTNLLKKTFAKGKRAVSHTWWSCLCCCACECFFLSHKIILSLLSDYQTKYSQIFASSNFQAGKIIGIFLCYEPRSNSWESWIEETGGHQFLSRVLRQLTTEPRPLSRYPSSSTPKIHRSKEIEIRQQGPNVIKEMRRNLVKDLISNKYFTWRWEKEEGICIILSNILKDTPFLAMGVRI